MLEWLNANASTIIILFAVILIIGLDILYLVRSKKKGKTLCGHNCTGCAMQGQCHNEAVTAPKKEKHDHITDQ